MTVGIPEHRIDHYRDKAGKWRWRITAHNGRIIGSSSQGYASLAASSQNLGDICEALNDYLRPGVT